MSRPGRAGRTAAGSDGRHAGVALARSPFEPRIIAWGIGVGLALALVAAVIGWPLAAMTPIAAEAEVIAAVEAGDAPWVRRVAMLFSHIGHLVPVAGVAVLVALVAWWRWSSWDLGLLLLVVLGGASTVTGTVKLLTSRVRPDGGFVETLSSAYPSGHAVRAAAVYGLILWLTLSVARRPWVRVVLVVLTVTAIVLNALARMALVAHWPTDVVVGMAIGATWLGVSLWLLRPRVLTPAREAPTADWRGGRPATN